MLECEINLQLTRLVIQAEAEFMNKRLTEDMYATALALASMSSVISTQAVAKENSQNTKLIEVKQYYSEQEIIDFMTKDGFEFVSHTEDYLVFNRDSYTVVITNYDIGLEFLSWADTFEQQYDGGKYTLLVGRYQSGLKLLLPLVEQGHANGMCVKR